MRRNWRTRTVPVGCICVGIMAASPALADSWTVGNLELDSDVDHISHSTEGSGKSDASNSYYAQASANSASSNGQNSFTHAHQEFSYKRVYTKNGNPAALSVLLKGDCRAEATAGSTAANGNSFSRGEAEATASAGTVAVNVSAVANNSVTGQFPTWTAYDPGPANTNFRSDQKSASINMTMEVKGSIMVFTVADSMGTGFHGSAVAWAQIQIGN